MPVACVCAADGSGLHLIEIGYEPKPAPRLPAKTWAQVRSLRTPCDFAEADAVDRLGGITCVGTLADIRTILSGRAPSMTSSKLNACAMYAQHQRANRQRGGMDPWDPHATWSPYQRRLMRAEGLLTARLYRLWPLPYPDDVRMNLRLMHPQIQISIRGDPPPGTQAVFEFSGQQTRRRRTPSWKLKSATGTTTLQHEMIELLLDKLIPAPVVRAAIAMKEGT